MELVADRLSARGVDIYSDIGPEPTNEDCDKLVAFLDRFRPQAIVALGGGSVLDLAKAARLGHEHPDEDWTDLALPFLDVRKRIAEYPQRRPDAMRLVAIPTTSGTGSEVSPAAVLTHAQTGRKTTLVDYTLVPDIAIVDPTLDAAAVARHSVPTAPALTVSPSRVSPRDSEKPPTAITVIPCSPAWS